MKIDLCFQGYIREVELTHVYDHNFELMSVALISPVEVQERLNRGEWTVALSHLLGENLKEEIELFDFEVK